ncbi:MAG TPA: iron-containing alcohol dehydrogenase [Gaiellaceae bacterium]|nr:iron-containing alcohol dehydrogenase [Gaiellaceae bacterium]
MIVRWGLSELPDVLGETGIERPFLIANERWTSLDLPHVARWTEVPSHRVEVTGDADGILAVGGGSAIDTGKYASAQSGLPLVSVPTTYSGAEWTTFYGIRSPDRRMQGGGAGASPAGIVYDVELTLDLPRDVTAGTALNAFAHCAEALYVKGRSPEGDEQAWLGTPLIVEALPRVLATGEGREELLRGAMHAGHALGLAGLGLGHAMAQAVGGAYGLPHGAMNALCLPPALEYNRAFVPEGFPVEQARELARLGGFERLRDFGVPKDDLPALGAAAAQRGGNKANPREASADEITALFRSIY